MYSIQETFVFQTEIYTFRTFIRCVCCFSFLFSPVRISCCCCCFFFHEEHEDMPLSWQMILFRIFRLFGSEESVWSEITNPFLDSPQKTHPFDFYFILGKRPGDEVVMRCFFRSTMFFLNLLYDLRDSTTPSSGPTCTYKTMSNYSKRMIVIWRILQNKKGVIRARRITLDIYSYIK